MPLKLYLLIVKIVRAMPFLHKLIWHARVRINALRFKLVINRPIFDGGVLIEAAIKENRPFAAGKMGSTEASGAKTYLARSKGKHKSYPGYIYHTLFVNSGVFPQSEEFYDRFYPAYLKAVGQCDALVTWDIEGEVDVFKAYCPNTAFISLTSIEPFFSSAVWTRALKGKKVLVISPFIESIKKQYPKHNELWDIPGLLPDFDLLTLRAPLSAGLVKSPDADWFETFNKLTAQMDALDYDVALIGAGAFSLPLAVHAKNRGKVGVHLGGNLQFLFGIYGNRWKTLPDYKDFIKENWVRPEGEEKPANAQTNENAAYW